MQSYIFVYENRHGTDIIPFNTETVIPLDSQGRTQDLELCKAVGAQLFTDLDDERINDGSDFLQIIAGKAQETVVLAKDYDLAAS